VETDYNDRVGGYNSWWDVPVSEVSSLPAVEEASRKYQEAKRRQKYFVPRDDV